MDKRTQNLNNIAVSLPHITRSAQAIQPPNSANMLYTYQFTTIEADGRLGKQTEKIDSSTWPDYLKAQSDRYGNLDEFIVASFPALSGENPLFAASLADQIDDIFSDKEPTAVFQYLMYCWDAFEGGRISAKAWGAALAFAWHCGERAMLDHVQIKEAQILRMFEAADKEALLRVGASRQDWESYFTALPEQLDIYRGISTASSHLENGLSWTTHPEEAKRFAGRSVFSASDIPGVIHAQVPKTALLAVFEGGDEVLIDPRVAKLNVTNNFLKGTSLNKFRQNWKKWKADEIAKIKESRKDQ